MKKLLYGLMLLTFLFANANLLKVANAQHNHDYCKQYLNSVNSQLNKFIEIDERVTAVVQDKTMTLPQKADMLNRLSNYIRTPRRNMLQLELPRGITQTTVFKLTSSIEHLTNAIDFRSMAIKYLAESYIDPSDKSKQEKYSQAMDNAMKEFDIGEKRFRYIERVILTGQH